MNEEIVAHPVQQVILPVILAHCTLVSVSLRTLFSLQGIPSWVSSTQLGGN